VFHPTSAGSFSSHYTSTPSVLTALDYFRMKRQVFPFDLITGTNLYHLAKKKNESAKSDSSSIK